MGDVTDIDHGWDAIKAAMRQSEVVRVGIIGAKAAATEAGGVLTVAEVAAVHEFGLAAPRVPERSFIRATVDKQRRQITAFVERIGGKVGMGEIPLTQGLNMLGLKVQADIQEAISGGIPPINKPSTIARKGSSKPLVDTGQLKASVTYVVGER